MPSAKRLILTKIVTPVFIMAAFAVLLFGQMGYGATAGLNKLDTPKDWAEVVATVNLRHPRLLTTTFKYRHSPYKILQDASQLARDLEAIGALATLEYRPEVQLSARLNLTDQTVYDEEALDRLQAGLLTDFENLHLVLGDSAIFTGLKNDLMHLENRLDLPQRKSLLRLLPFIYDAEGRATRMNLPEPSDLVLPGPTLDSRFNDLYLLHLAPKLEEYTRNDLRSWQELVHEVNADFYQSAVPSGLVRKKGEVRRTNVTLSIERVAALVALFRGPIGFDCSLQSTALYALLAGVHVYWIRDSLDFKRDPIGYILVADIYDSSGSKAPYVITINGTHLDSVQGRAAMLEVAADYGSDFWYVPNPLLKDLTNTQGSREAMGYSINDLTVEDVHLPLGWDLVDEYYRVHSPYDIVYYDRHRLQRARRMALTTEEKASLARTPPSRSYALNYPSRSIAELSPLDQALLSVSFGLDVRINSTLTLTPLQKRAAKDLSDIFKTEVPTVNSAQFERLKTAFGLLPVQVLRLLGKGEFQLPAVRELWRINRDLLSEDDWFQVGQGLAASLAEKIKSERGSEGFARNVQRLARIWEGLPPISHIPRLIDILLREALLEPSVTVSKTYLRNVKWELQRLVDEIPKPDMKKPDGDLLQALRDPSAWRLFENWVLLDLALRDRSDWLPENKAAIETFFVQHGEILIPFLRYYVQSQRGPLPIYVNPSFTLAILDIRDRDLTLSPVVRQEIDEFLQSFPWRNYVVPDAICRRLPAAKSETSLRLACHRALTSDQYDKMVRKLIVGLPRPKGG